MSTFVKQHTLTYKLHRTSSNTFINHLISFCEVTTYVFCFFILTGFSFLIEFNLLLIKTTTV